MLPVLLAARVVPKGGEIFDRSSSFLFLPFSLLIGHYAVRFWWHEPRQHSPGHGWTHWYAGGGRRAASLMFVGGYILGSGPTWSRLPGPYLVSADSRSMDSEMLAAVAWSRDNLQPGSRIGADRVNSTVFAAEAGVWPMVEKPRPGYSFAVLRRRLGPRRPRSRASAIALPLRRPANGRQNSHLGAYFVTGETSEIQQLTDWELTKFDSVPGIAVVYRHGPISIYDLKGIGVQELRNGWYGETPNVTLLTQLAVGLLGGFLVGLTLHSRLRPRLGAMARRWYEYAGPALTLPIVLAAATLLSITLLLLHIWLTPRLSRRCRSGAVDQPAIGCRAGAHRVGAGAVATGRCRGRCWPSRLPGFSPSRPSAPPSATSSECRKSWTILPRFMFRPAGTGAPK